MLFAGGSSGLVAKAQDVDQDSEDMVEGEEGDDATVETDEGPEMPEPGSDAATTEEKVP